VKEIEEKEQERNKKVETMVEKSREKEKDRNFLLTG
jgi:hypothetical protein